MKQFYFFRFLPVTFLLLLNVINVIQCHRSKVVPTNYKLNISLDSNSYSYRGAVIIDFSVSEKVNMLKLNSDGIQIDSAIVRAHIAGTSLTLNSEWSIEDDKLIIDLKDSHLPVNSTGQVVVGFSNTVKQNQLGMFRGRCGSTNGSWVITTLMEPVYASTVFPCFDVAMFKTPMMLNITIKSNLEIMTSFKNRWGTSISMDRSTKEITFSSPSTTPMALGLIVYDPLVMKRNPSGVFACSNNIFKLDPVKQSWGLLKGKLAVNSTNDQWRYFLLPDLIEDFTQFPDLTFLREEFGSTEDMSYIDKANALLTLSEVAGNQIIGSDITFPTFSELWFFKGFNHLFKYNSSLTLSDNKDVTDYIRISFLRDLQDAFEGNRLRKTKPISNHVHSYRSIKSLYDSSSFAKAGIIFKMVENLMGSVSFYKTISSLVEEAMQKTNGTLESHNIFYKLNTYYLGTNLPRNVKFAEVVNGWVHEPGYPVLRVLRKGDTIEITQKSIIPDSSRHWWVPVKLWTSNAAFHETFWLKPGDILTLPLPANTQWYLVNADLNGLYRVNYHTNDWFKLYEEFPKFSEEVKAKLLDDVLGLAKEGLLPYQVALRFTRRLVNESSLMVWSTVVPHFAYIRCSLVDWQRNAWEEYVLSLVMEVKNLTQNDTNSKMKFVDIFCATNRFICFNVSSMFMNQTDISMGRRDWAASQICADVESNLTTWDMYLNEYHNKKTPSSEQRILSGLTCSTNETIIKRFLHQFTKNESSLKRQDFIKVLTGLSWSEENALILLKWLVSNNDFIQEFLPRNTKVITDITTEISKSIFKISAIMDLKKLSLLNNTDGYARERAMERIRLNSAHRSQMSPSVATWLVNRDDPAADKVFAKADKVISCLLGIFFLQIIISFI